MMNYRFLGACFVILGSIAFLVLAGGVFCIVAAPPAEKIVGLWVALGATSVLGQAAGGFLLAEIAWSSRYLADCERKRQEREIARR